MHGRFISGPAALFILLFFFLPWIIVSCNGASIGELSGYDLARGSLVTTSADTLAIPGRPLLYTIPAVSLITLSLIALTWRRPHQATNAAWIQAGLTLTVLLLLLWQYRQLQPEPEASYQLITQPALWGTLLGLLLILTGAIVDIISHDRAPSHTPSAPNKLAPRHSPLAPRHSPLATPHSPLAPDPEAAEPDLFMPAAFPPTAAPEPNLEPSDPTPGTPTPIPPGRLSPRTEMLQPESNILAWLIVREGEETGKQHRLRENMIIGRDPDCDIIVQDSAVSGKHIRVYVQNGRFFAADLNSSNGTFVHETQQDRWSKIEEIEMKDGTQIKLGRTVLHLMTLANKNP